MQEIVNLVPKLLACFRRATNFHQYSLSDHVTVSKFQSQTCRNCHPSAQITNILPLNVWKITYNYRVCSTLWGLSPGGGTCSKISIFTPQGVVGKSFRHKHLNILMATLVQFNPSHIVVAYALTVVFTK